MLRRGVKVLVLTFALGLAVDSVFAGNTATDDIKILQEDVTEISERLDNVETKSILDRVTIGGEFRTRMDYFKYEDMSGAEENGETEDIWSNRLRLNLKAEVTDNITFHGRLSYFKLWGENNFEGLAYDMTYPSNPDPEGDIHTERAYIDYFFTTIPLSFSFGRLSICEGPPNELRDNTTRKAVWPKVLFDGEMDGILLGLSLDDWTGLRNSMARVLYAKIFQNYRKYEGVDLHDTRAFPTFGFETEIPGVKDSLFWFSFAKAQDITFNTFPIDLGYADVLTLHFQFNNIMDSGLDWFISGEDMRLYTESESFAGLGIWGDVRSGNLGEDRKAHAVYTGLRYRLPFEKLKFPKVGFEYNHGSKYWAGLFTAGSGDLVNKLSINGDAYELYYIQPIYEKHMFLRAGLVYMDYNYYNPLLIFGNQQESDMKLTNIYLLMDVRF